MSTMQAANNNWIMYNQEREAPKGRLICFPYAGCAASIFRTWPDLLGDDIEVLPIQLPGRETRLSEKPCHDVEALIDTLFEVLHPYLNLPFAFFGHSMGTFLCYELQLKIKKELGKDAVRFFVSGGSPPNTTARLLNIARLPDKEFVDTLVEHGGIPQLIVENPDFLSFFVPIIRNDFILMESYLFKPSAPLNTPLTLLGGTRDQMISEERLKGWEEFTALECELHMFDGGHFFINEYTKEIVTLIKNQLVLQSNADFVKS